ncbi:MAG: DUF2182 domain-containing protein [Leptospirales bacterium]|jgi:predicted metal-binding membrane protein
MILTERSFEGAPAQVYIFWFLTGTIWVACWIYFLAGGGTGMSVMAMSTVGLPALLGGPAVPGPWSAGYTVTMLTMWWTMMLAMMLPGAFQHFPKQEPSRGAAGGTAPRLRRLPGFALGYSAHWFVFSLAAVAVQYAIEALGILDGMKLWSVRPDFSAALLVFAGLYQFTGFKRRALNRCGRETASGAGFSAGFRYGLHCLQASFALMLLLFVGGVMNLYWAVALTVIVALEKKLEGAPSDVSVKKAAGLPTPGLRNVVGVAALALAAMHI